MKTVTNPTIQQLKQAIEIREKIEVLEGELSTLLSGAEAASHIGRRKMSAAARAKIAAAQRARWAKVNGKKPRRKMSAAGRAKIAAAARERWKKAKAAGKTRL